MSRTDDDNRDVTEIVGATALGVAWARARESRSAQPLFTDPHAQQFIDAAAEQGWRPPSGEIGDYAAARTKWFDEFFIAAGANGVEQSVILAAGLDARAWRLPWTSNSTVFEIDRPQVLAFKADTLRSHGVEPAARYTAVAVDLQQDWPKALQDSGFNPSEPTAWSAEGLLPHLPAAGQDLLFERVNALSAPGSRITVEAFGPEAPEGEERADVADWLANHGWRTTVTPAQNLITHFHREIPEAMPRTEFVSAEFLGC